MKRWNGWGTENTPYPLPPAAAAFLQELVGPGTPRPDASFESVCARVPPSRLPPHPLVSADPGERVRRARGHSLPDWVELKSGQITTFPDGVACPTSEEEVRALISYARSVGAALIPYGGGSSVVGHINPLADPNGSGAGEQPVLTLDMCRMNRLLELDETSHLATFEAGARGPEVEAALNARGYTLGHFPQSWEYSTLGGWIASRSVGTQCYYYGRIEELFAGGELETPQGHLHLPSLPASAAGPDLRQLVLGSEGRLGVITRAVVRVQPLPRCERFSSVFFPDWEQATAALREIVQSRIAVSMLRLSNAVETETTLQLSGKPDLVNLAHQGLGLIGIGEQRCLLIFGLTGAPDTCRLAARQVAAVARRHKGLVVNPVIGHMWHKSRFTTPYLRNTLWDAGYAIDTLETALPWSQLLPAFLDVQQKMRDSMADSGEKVHIFAHLSHMYNDGASMYIQYLWRLGASPEETLERWRRIKTAASRRIVELGGTISHQHGVGTDHAPYLPAEKGELGLRALGDVFRTFDPSGMMNPGKLIQP